MSRVYVVARIVARSGSVNVVHQQLSSLLAPTRSEAGCIVYDLFQNQADPTDFTFYEEWESAAGLDAHLAWPPDVRRYSKAG